MLRRSNTGASHFAAGVPAQKRVPRRARVIFAAIALLMISGLALGVTFGLRGGVTRAASSQLGLNVDANEQAFVDMAGYHARIDSATGQDAQGWPASDFRYIIDNRYTFGWVSDAVNIDPLKKSTDISGTYKLVFKGQATLTDTCDDPAHCATTISNQSYDAGSNTTTADLTLGNPAGGVLMILNFSQTKRDASAASGTGVTDLHMWRPGYTPGTSQVFTDKWMDSLTSRNWAAFRFMGFTGTNGYGDPATDKKPYSELYPYRLKWSDRVHPGDGPLQGNVHPGVHENPWEYVVLIAQATGKDIWINIPVNASDDYVNELAKLLKNGNEYTNNKGIPESSHVYVEYSNEMWHFGFFQGSWNNQAAKDEVAAGGTNLNYDGQTNDYNLLIRRIAKRTVEIGKQFKNVFSADRIRPVTNNYQLSYNPDMLKYVKDNYGTVIDVLYGISSTAYYTSADASSVDAIIAGEKAASDNLKKDYQSSRALADQYGIHSLVYEGGQDEQGNPKAPSPLDPTLANKFGAARDPRMQEVEYHDIVDNWYGSGGELYMQFGHVGRWSTYGMWGLSDDINDQTTGKWKGVDQVLGTTPSNPTPTPTTPTGVTPTVGTTPTVGVTPTVGTTPIVTPTVPAGTATYLSDLNWTSASSGYGDVQKDKSNGGNTITLRGTTYSKGLGTHAESDIRYNLGGNYSTLTANLGVDDEAWGNGTVVFQVYGDGKLLYDSGKVGRDDAVKQLNISVSGVSELRLYVTDAGDGNFSDHADWADIKVS